MERQIISDIAKNKYEFIRISRGDYKDKTYIDIRLFFTDRMSGELKPTKKGITIPSYLVNQLKIALGQCEGASVANSAKS